jgi:hypothetical protein
MKMNKTGQIIGLLLIILGTTLNIIEMLFKEITSSTHLLVGLALISSGIVLLLLLTKKNTGKKIQ